MHEKYITLSVIRLSGPLCKYKKDDVISQFTGDISLQIMLMMIII